MIDTMRELPSGPWSVVDSTGILLLKEGWLIANAIH